MRHGCRGEHYHVEMFEVKVAFLFIVSIVNFVSSENIDI